MTFHPTFRTNVYLEMQLSGKAPSNSFEFHLQLWKNQNKRKQKIKQQKKQNKIKKTKSNQIIKQTKKIQTTNQIKKKTLTIKLNTATSLTNEI